MPFEPRKPRIEAAKEDDQVHRWEEAVNSLRSVYNSITQGRLAKVSLRSRSRFKSVPYVPYRTYEGGASPFPEEHIRGF